MLLQYILTEEQHTEIFIKALLRDKFKFHMWRIGVVDNPFLAKMEFLKMKQEIINLISL